MNETQLTVVAGVPAGAGDAALAAALSPAFEFLGTAGTLNELIERALDEIPDVIVLHEALGLAAFASLARDLRDRIPASRLVVITSQTDTATLEAVRGGVSCVVPADSSASELVEAVRACARGESTLSAEIAAGVLAEMTSWATPDPDPVVRKPTLTLTENQVLTRLAEGRTPAEIAAEKEVTARLVNLQVGYAVAKLQLHLARERKLVAH